MGYGHVIQTEMHYGITDACVELAGTTEGLRET